MSSREYAADLPISDALRRIVIASGIAAGLAGFVCILALPLEPKFVAAFAVIWLAFSLREITTLRSAYSAYRHLRIRAGGAVTLRGPTGEPVIADLLPGSLVLRRVAWLRLEVENGCRFGELVVGNSRKNKDWRHLQVIWRHL